MAEKFSLKDHLFNAETIGQLAAEYAAGLPGFDAPRFVDEALSGFSERELTARLDWMADCLERHLADDFATMADQLEAMMPTPLDPSLKDDDFGHFIHAVPGILAVRHGLETHRERAFDLLYEATKRFSMEFYIRAFLNRWPEETLARLSVWSGNENYHVRRLVSEGTRPKLPWAKAVDLSSDQTLPLLDKLHSDPTRYVTRSVSNHLNDIAKNDPDLVLKTLARWGKQARQVPKELDWMQRHALRTMIKDGHPGAMAALGYRSDLDVKATLLVASKPVKIDGALEFSAQITTQTAEPVIVDYVLHLTKADGGQTPKVFKLKVGKTKSGQPLTVKKVHKLKGDATTFKLYPGDHHLHIQINGRRVGSCPFVLKELP